VIKHDVKSILNPLTSSSMKTATCVIYYTFMNSACLWMAST